MNLNLKRLYSSYKEVLTTGYLNSYAEGEFVRAELRVQVSGDILNFLESKDKVKRGKTEFLNLIENDTLLYKNLAESERILKIKLDGITDLPRFMIWVANIFFSATLIIPWIRKFICDIELLLRDLVISAVWALIWGVVFWLLRRYGFKLVAWIVKFFI